jgi:poly(hydroxyalkanoate) granule-associated protein
VAVAGLEPAVAGHPHAAQIPNTQQETTMVKKISKPAAKTAAKAGEKGSDKGSDKGAQASHLAASVKDSAQHIWLAGMGAFSKAQEEGTKVFEALVKEGLTLQKKTQGIAEEKLGDVAGKMSAMADTVSAKAGQNWDKLEAIFEQRTAKALSKLGVPTAKDVAALSARVDALAAAVSKAGKTAAKAPAPAAKPVKAKVAKAVEAPKAVEPEVAAVVEAPVLKAPARRARKTAAA